MINEIRELVKELNIYCDAYYNKNESLISDYEYDQKFDRLKKLEEATGFVLANSPTSNVGCSVVSELKEVVHNHPMLSLDKTKSTNEVKSFLGSYKGLAMLKMDGLTISLKYINGVLVSAETRGNGVKGEDVLHNVNQFINLPKIIPVKEEVVIDGEAIITLQTFEKLREIKRQELISLGASKGLQDEELEDFINKNNYKNPRNLCSGSVRQLDSSVSKERNIQFIAWKVIKGINFKSFGERLEALSSLGFEVVPWKYVEKVEDVINFLKESATEKGYPIDGIVFSFDDVAYGDSLGSTGHHVKSQLAYKFYDEEVETVLKDIEWTMGKTGVLTPTAIFEPVEIDGTTVERASLHNVSIMKQLELSYGDTITVYKANQIIPQVKENLDKSLKNICLPPSICPICEGDAEIIKENNTEVLICTNPQCKGKLLGELCTFVSKEAHDIKGLSEAILGRMIQVLHINSPLDLFYLDHNKIKALPRMGDKSAEKLLNEIQKSRDTTLSKFLYSLSIPLIGRSASKAIEKLENKFAKERGLTIYESFIYTMENSVMYSYYLDGFGDNMQKSLANYYTKNKEFIKSLAAEFVFGTNLEEKAESNILAGETICITGSLEEFSNRSELVSKIESLGGKVTSSVSKKTTLLINNDKASKSSKNVKAMELNIPILSEKDFLKHINKKS